jgi:two-component system OmpR family response regulator
MAMGTRILAVEDDERIRTAVKLALEDEGWTVEEAETGEDALTAFHRQPADVVLIDIMLPGIDGFEVCRSIRRLSDVPIVMVTARADTHDVVAGLEAGADDYLTKPFALDELYARLRAVTRREPAERPVTLSVNDLTLDPVTRVVRRGDTEINLSPKEYTLLAEFMRRPDEALSRTYLIEHVWDFAYDGTSNIVDAYIRHLRGKIDRPFDRDTIKTVRSVGYRLDPTA